MAEIGHILVPRFGKRKKSTKTAVRKEIAERDFVIFRFVCVFFCTASLYCLECFEKALLKGFFAIILGAEG